MFNPLDSTVLLIKTVQNEPNLIVRPIANFLGWILDFVFNIVDAIAPSVAMGIAIIVFTFIVRMLMLPIAFKQQKSMVGMQRLQPEVEKIRKKYGSTKDPEIQKKMNTELQALYSKNNVNPFSGCLPLIIQFPIFFALMYIMNQPYMFINKLGEVYKQIASNILSVVDLSLPQYQTLYNIIIGKVSTLKNGLAIGTEHSGNFEKVLNVMTMEEWRATLDSFPVELQQQLEPLLAQKNIMEHFLTLNLQSTPGWGIAGIFLLILAVTTTFLSSWIMMRHSKAVDQMAKTQQKMLMYMMPVMMGYFTVTMPAGVGIYWVASSIFQIIQQIILNNYYNVNSDKK